MMHPAASCTISYRGEAAARVALCIEASHACGMGHLFRGLAIAQVLNAHGASVTFYVNEFEPALAILQEKGFGACVVPIKDFETGWEVERIRDDGIQVWVNDRLDTDIRHTARVRGSGACLATIDDRGSGSALADLNIVAFPADGEKLHGSRVVTGIEHLILDPVLSGYRRQRKVMQKIVVSMGGSDTYGITVDVVRALRDRNRAATIVLGPGFAHETELAAVLTDRFVVRRGVSSLAAEFALHDLAITAGGMTPCEANATGLPAVIIAAELWEVRIGKLLAGLGGSVYAGTRDAIDFSIFDRTLPIETMSRAALATVPTDGAERVARELLALCVAPS